MFSILNKIYLGVAAVILSIVSLFVFGASKKREGAAQAETSRMIEEHERKAKGKRNAFKEKRDVDGISDGDLIDRLRRRSDDWGKL